MNNRDPVQMDLRHGPKMVTFVCGNQSKIKEIKQILEPHILLNYADVDLVEHQGSSDYICTEKCKTAAIMLNGAVIVEDVSFCFRALNGLPGPYIKDFMKKIGTEGLVKLLVGYEDKSAQAVCTVAFTRGPDQEVHLITGIADGEIVEPRGSGFGWDPCFMPKDNDKTYGEMSEKDKNSISHRCKALNSLKHYLLSIYPKL